MGRRPLQMPRAVRHVPVWAVAAFATLLSVGCASLLAADPTPVPGAAATLTRSINTPIPTPVRTPSTVPGASASPSRVAVALSPSAASAATAASVQAMSDTSVADLQRRIEQAVASPDLPGMDALLLDHVALSTPQGGNVMDEGTAAQWLREHAGQGIKVTQVDRGTQEVMLQVQTEGWPTKDPIQQGQVLFSLRRYDANGRQDETGAGDWKIDVISVD
jgi:hypothetical protein